MKQHTHPALALALAIALTSGSRSARAQEPEVDPAPPRPTSPVPIQPPQDDAQRQMIELFGKVERELRAIDRLLQEAARSPSAGSGGSLAEQLRNAQASGESVQRDIDKILELAASQQPSSSSSSSGGESKPSPGGNPMDRQGEQSTGRESTPSMPQSGGEKPEPGGQEPGQGQEPGSEKPGSQPKPGDQKPGEQGRDPKDGPQGSKAEPQQNPGADPARGAQGAGSTSNDARDRWGELPMHAREVFRSEGGRDMPPLYREWIDAYYKRLNKKP